ncbi:hypothetical protein TNCV_543461 [Trichonephila clavipes]|nr:hypothetical protein TNCV_543461 [Trichonephila clavipes]
MVWMCFYLNNAADSFLLQGCKRFKLIFACEERRMDSRGSVQEEKKKANQRALMDSSPNTMDIRDNATIPAFLKTNGFLLATRKRRVRESQKSGVSIGDVIGSRGLNRRGRTQIRPASLLQERSEFVAFVRVGFTRDTAGTLLNAEKHILQRRPKHVFKMSNEWSETSITGNNSFQCFFFTLPHVNWADIENYVEFLSKERPDIEINDNRLFEVERKLNVYLNCNKLKQLENQHAEKLIKDG